MAKAQEAPRVSSQLRRDNIAVPKVIEEASGIHIFDRNIKSLLFSTDVATICYTNADAILAVYPYTPHPAIIQAITNVSASPVLAGVGGGLTSGQRSADIALFAEASGVLGVVVNAPIALETIHLIESTIDSPIIQTVVSEYANIEDRLAAGVDILNVASGKQTKDVVAWIRQRYPNVPIIATGGRTEESIRGVIEAGANAVSWAPPTSAELFNQKMNSYREESRTRFIDTHDGMTLNEYEKSQRQG